MSILVDEYEPVEDVEDDPFGEDRDVYVRTDVWVTTEYEILPEILGRGRFGEVKRCRQCSTAKEFAAKFILAPRPQDKKDVEHEVEVMKKLRHRRLLQVYDAFSFKNETCLILEIIQGGELFDRVIDETFILTEKACKCFVRQICEGVEYMHASNIIHLDLKPENILCLSKTGNRIKIIDFGLAREYDPRKELRVLFGTPEFMAPEVVQYDTINFATDIWSIGVISYVLLSGLSPFMGDSDGDTLTNVIKVDYSFDYEEFTDISEDAKDLIHNVLQRDKRKRLSAVECLAHPWLRTEERTPPQSPTLDLSKQRLKHFVYRRKWKKAVHAIIAMRRMGAQFINVARKRSMTRLEAAARAQREAENAVHRSNKSCSNESKAKEAVAVMLQADNATNATNAVPHAIEGNATVSTPSKTSVGGVKSSPKVKEDDKTQRHSKDDNTIAVPSKKSETTKGNKTVPLQKNKLENVVSETKRSKSKPKPNDKTETTAALSKDVVKRKSPQRLAKDNFNSVKKRLPEPVIGVNKSVIFQLPTLRKTPKKANNSALPIKQPAGNTENEMLTNKSTPKWKLHKADADKQVDSTAKETPDKHVEPKAKRKDSDKHAESKEKDNNVFKHAELKPKDNGDVKSAQKNIKDNDAVKIAESKPIDDGAAKCANDSKRKEICIGQYGEPKPSQACLARNELNRSPVKDNNQKERRRYEKRPSSELGDAVKTEDFDDSSSVESINRLCMQWPPPETDKPLHNWKPRIRIINKVGDVLKPDGTIDEELTISTFSAGPKQIKPRLEKLIIEKTGDKKVKPTVLPPKPKVQFAPKVLEMPDSDKPDAVNGPPRVTKRPKRPCLNGDDAPDCNVRKTSGGRKAVLDRCPWSRKENHEADERRRKPNREPDDELNINHTTTKWHSETDTSNSSTTITTTNKTTTSSILRRSSLTRRERLGSDEDGVPEKPWSKPRRIIRRDELNDTLYLSVNDNAKRRPHRQPVDGDASSDGESARAASDDAAFSDGSCSAYETASEETASEASSTRVRVMHAVAKWMNMAKTNNGVDYRRWRKGEGTPSAPCSPEPLSSETAPLGLGPGSSASSVGVASPIRESAPWPNKATSTYVER